MASSELTRRDALKAGAAGAAGLSVLTVAGPAAAFPAAQAAATVVVPWLDQPPPVPEPAQGVIPRQLRCEDLDTRITPKPSTSSSTTTACRRCPRRPGG